MQASVQMKVASWTLVLDPDDLHKMKEGCVIKYVSDARFEIVPSPSLEESRINAERKSIDQLKTRGYEFHSDHRGYNIFVNVVGRDPSRLYVVPGMPGLPTYNTLQYAKEGIEKLLHLDPTWSREG